MLSCSSTFEMKSTSLAFLSEFFCLIATYYYRYSMQVASGRSGATNSVLSTQLAQGLKDPSRERLLLQRKNKKEGYRGDKDNYVRLRPCVYCTPFG